MTTIQSAWAIYFAGSLGCTIAAWWLFLWAWRFVRYSAVVTVMTILFTPYAIDPQTMTMAPAIYTMVFDGLSLGVDSIKPLIKLMIGIWLIAIILVAVFVILTRKSGHQHADHSYPGQPGYTGRRAPAVNPPPFEKIKRDKRFKKAAHKVDNSSKKGRSRSTGLNREEQQARDEIFKGDIPMRAIRD